MWLYEFDFNSDSTKCKKELDQIITIAKNYGLDGLNIENVSDLDSSYIEKVKHQKLQIFCWTVNDPVRARSLVKSGIDGITTDRPDWLKNSLQQLIL